MYKRKNYPSGELMSVYKGTEEGVIAVYDDFISVHSALSIDEDFPKEEGYKNTTKKVFDKMYNETMKRFKNMHS